jgi:hypothetical protein
MTHLPDLVGNKNILYQQFSNKKSINIDNDYLNKRKSVKPGRFNEDVKEEILS